MHRTSYRIPVNLSPEQTWAKLSDFSLAIHYVPGLTSLEMLTEQHSGLGASREVSTGGKVTIQETVVSWEDMKGFSLRLHRGEDGPVPPMTEAYYDYGMEVVDGQVYLSNAMRYTVGLGLVGRCLNWLAIGKVIAGSVRDSTIAQKLYYESGETVTPQQLKTAKKALAGS